MKQEDTTRAGNEGQEQDSSNDSHSEHGQPDKNPIVLVQYLFFGVYCFVFGTVSIPVFKNNFSDIIEQFVNTWVQNK